MKPAPKNIILHLSTYPPRECGIATFTRDLAYHFDKHFNPITKTKVAALNETQTAIYNYSPKVIDHIPANNLENYVELAKRINQRPEVKVVNIQHEFGLFGGNWGDYLIPFIQVVKKPKVVTFHSVLPEPDAHLKHVVRLINKNADALVVMNKRSVDVLINDYKIEPDKIHIVPHGIPQTTFEPSEKFKAELGLKDRIILSTFGLLSEDKGIQYAIRALPKVVKKFPNVLYLIIGATHPVVRQEQGEAYRKFLQKEIERLKLKNNVKFYNKYLSLEEIIYYLKATDLYISTVINPRQSVSGTISYALGCGRATISAPTEYARYIIEHEYNGLLAKKMKHPPSISNLIIQALSDEKFLNSMHINAFESTRHMTWPNVARAYFNIYKKFANLDEQEKKLPPIKLNHLTKLTDDFGIVHHARLDRPEKKFGYSIDDNARALKLIAFYNEFCPNPQNIELARTYLKFIKYGQTPGGRFVNIIGPKKQKLQPGDEDSFGRVIMALGILLSAEKMPADIQKTAKKLFQKSIPLLTLLKAPRPIAFAISGLYYYLQKHPNKKLEKALKQLADRLVKMYRNESSESWQWFEDCLTYSNSKMPEALFYAYKALKDPTYLQIAETTLKFLSKITFEPNHYSPIGQHGWYFKYKKRAYFDQQPEDTAAMVETKIVAYQITKKRKHLEDAFTAFQWFLGKNHLNQTVYDEVTGGCHDGLDKYSMNLNQGAESTISYLTARVFLEALNHRSFNEKF